MRIQCDVCEKATAAVICCADEAALCVDCDVRVHAANKLAGKHQRLLLDCPSAKLPRCDICQEKTAFIFCVEDRALFCRECDASIHVAGTLSGEHQRLLATGIHVALAPACSTPAGQAKRPPPGKAAKSPPATKAPAVAQPPSAAYSSSNWAVDDFLQLSDYECNNDKKEASLGFGELEWLADIDLFPDTVPELAIPYAAAAFYKSSKPTGPSFKKARIEFDDEFFRVPDLG